ncbi:FLYWCH zinc finger domain-containing protein [Phthorimaea operculella]|nr:FLYWCH zinc finger domain-containing protein [Phthorimaea operculella]
MRWACMKMKLKCRACLTITKEGEVIRVNAEHNHPPPRFEIRDVRWIKSCNGKSTIVIYDGYSFYHQKMQKSVKNMRWACMKMKMRCRAFLTTNKEGKVIRVNSEHNHPPPRFEIRDGAYVKIKNNPAMSAT